MIFLKFLKFSEDKLILVNFYEIKYEQKSWNCRTVSTKTVKIDEQFHPKKVTSRNHPRIFPLSLKTNHFKGDQTEKPDLEFLIKFGQIKLFSVVNFKFMFQRNYVKIVWN
jgi:hypothetical protein